MFIIRDREAGNVIDTFATYEEALEMLNAYEESDKAEGIYEEGFYEIVEREGRYKGMKDFRKDKLVKPVTITDVVKLAEDYYRVEFLINNRFWGCQLFSDATMMPEVPNWRERLAQIRKGDKMPCWKTRIYDSDGSYNLYNLIPEKWHILA